MTLEEMTAQRDALAARYRGVRTVGVRGQADHLRNGREMAAALADLSDGRVFPGHR